MMLLTAFNFTACGSGDDEDLSNERRSDVNIAYIWKEIANNQESIILFAYNGTYKTFCM